MKIIGLLGYKTFRQPLVFEVAIPLQYNVQHGFELEIFIPAFVKSPCLTLVRLRSLFVAGIKISDSKLSDLKPLKIRLFEV